SEDTSLACRVSRGAVKRGSHRGVDRGDVDDAATLAGDHAWCRRSAHQIGSDKVHVDNLAPDVDVDAFGWTDLIDSGIVDQCVDRPEPADRQIDRTFRLVLIGNVAF